MAWQWKLISENCTGCGICYDVCRYKALVMSRDMAYPQALNGKCEGCLDCLEQCPFDAIEIKQMQTEDC